jgi:chromosome segregation protein
LFGGGFARLSLTDPSDLGATGVEIVARPAGQEAAGLAMLSGGERALTAVACCSRCSRSGRCRSASSTRSTRPRRGEHRRFADALRSAGRTTQFIVITHNRGTIEAADALTA